MRQLISIFRMECTTVLLLLVVLICAETFGGWLLELLDVCMPHSCKWLQIDVKTTLQNDKSDE